MNANAQTPEELEMLLEDSLLLRDAESLIALFAAGAVLATGEEESDRGKDIARLALATWKGEQTYDADPKRVIQAHDVALIISEQGINVVRRDSSGNWQYVIVYQTVQFMMKFTRR